MSDDRVIAEVERRQRAVAGELGAIDRSTSFESSRGRRFLYRAFKRHSCLVDIDEEPPHEINGEAVGLALRIAASLECNVPDELEVMRKEVVDGSDPSAFQRSTLVGYDGTVEVDRRKIPITSIFLEEESAGIEGTKDSAVTYNLDRLGVPLIEVDTDPSIKDPKEAKATALRIGLLLRLTGKAQRGIGSIRQDVNVSVKEGTRVEIKGMQELAMMDEVIDLEVERQLKLIEIMKELKKRKAEVGKTVDVTKIFKGTGSKIIGDSLKGNGVVLAFKASGFKGLLGREVNPGRRLGTEISEYAKMAGVKGLIHSDEDLSGYAITEKEMSELIGSLKVSKEDGFVMIAAQRGVCERAIDFARQRTEMALQGVPPETRAANSQNPTTRFMRPLPGGSRMYPETDAVPIEIDQGLYKELSKERLDIDSVKKKLEKQIKNIQLSDQMLWSEQLPLYERMVESTKAPPELVAAVLLEKFKELRRSGMKVEEIGDSALLRIFELYAGEKITKNGIEEILKALPKSAGQVDSTIKRKGLERMSKEELAKLIKQNAGKKRDETIREIMSKYRLRVDGEELNALLKN